jgi:pyruvate-formate lyase
MIQRLSASTHALARRALSGEYGRGMRNADFSLAEAGDLSGLSGDMRYAAAVRLIAERAPLRVSTGEMVVGSATLLEARRHIVPLLAIGSTSHTTIGFAHALKVGYAGLRQQIEARLQRGELDARGEDFLQAMLACLEDAAVWHRRHVALLQERIASSAGEERAGYIRVLASLSNVPENPPRTFHEALQALWFMFAFQRLCGNWPGIGRIDQMLGPFLEDDLAAGRLCLDEARELLAHFWIKGCEWIDGQPNIGSGDSQYYQNVILSGVDAGGQDVTNALTYLVLDVVEELGISDYPIAVRISPRTPKKLLRRIAEVQRLGGGIVAVYNEDMVIRALTRFGYALEEARSFANDGCWEVLVPGRTHFLYSPFDMLRLLQETLGVTSPELPEPVFDCFEALYAAFLARLKDHLQKFHQAADSFALNGVPAPLISIFVEDCIERGRGYHDRGAHYTVLAPHAGGLPDTANALFAIQKLVFEEDSLALGELVDILRRNWDGHEALRKRIRSRLAFYGNDNAEADRMVQRVFDDYVAISMEVPERSGVLRPPGLSTFGRQIEWAPQRGATAAGTWRGEFLANNFSPAPGSEKSGPTAVIRSFCAVDFEKLPNGTALELKIHPSAIKGEDGLEALTALLKTFVQLGGWFIHIDVVDSDMLRAAQLHPEQYANLAVRVSGWSARFVTLDHSWQDMVIARTEQEFH